MGKINSSWDNVAEDYAKSVGETGDINHQKSLNPVIFKILGNVKGKKVLDLACGQGYLSRMLAKKGAKITGLEISPKLLSIAKELEKKQKSGIQYVLGNSARMKSIKSNSFDFIVSNVSFHDTAEIEKTIKECHRVLRTSGRLVFSIIHPMNGISDKHKDKKGYYRKIYRYMILTSFPHFIFPQSRGIKYYHRPIEFYVNQLVKNGFLVSGLRELTTMYFKRKWIGNDEQMAKYKKEFPLFLVIEAVKK